MSGQTNKLENGTGPGRGYVQQAGSCSDSRGSGQLCYCVHYPVGLQLVEGDLVSPRKGAGPIASRNSATVVLGNGVQTLNAGYLDCDSSNSQAYGIHA